jgi:hypothetical protein
MRSSYFLSFCQSGISCRDREDIYRLSPTWPTVRSAGRGGGGAGTQAVHKQERRIKAGVGSS